jgi:hypothetical protein
MRVEIGQLRRFHDDAFIGGARRLNGKTFLVLDVSGPEHNRFVTILVDGTLDYDWGPLVLEDYSEVIDAG